jgi:hypothetical protein
MTERGDCRFIIKEAADDRPWIAAEPVGRSLSSILGHLGFELKVRSSKAATRSSRRKRFRSRRKLEMHAPHRALLPVHGNSGLGNDRVHAILLTLSGKSCGQKSPIPPRAAPAQ